MGHSHINKLLRGMNIPEYNWKTYKNHEIEVGLGAEELARESCIRAVGLERQLTIENADIIKKML